ncbi:MAG: carboxypeptidase regulatory-like domain-containing protein [Thermoguttaceae bacterium]|nr:carboxypeptidase regulatory-like domain-containing protein [Thermoguttaceae bacterium]MDW8038734.1 carboxypeptidase regulatory-like domain-containing protein [Thermoguttaceae bacterium]
MQQPLGTKWFWLVSLLVAGNLWVWRLPPVVAWGPHTEITQAALDVLPEMDKWKKLLGEHNIRQLTQYCWMPDNRGRDLGPFYADDYLLIRKMPYHVGHTMPAVQVAFEPYFRRALQAFRTETATNACRQLGPLLHFVEDVGAPPHAKVNCPHHGELENWVNAKQIHIQGYQPQLLGKTDEEAWQGLRRRIEGLVAFSTERAERALPLVAAAKPDRSKVEPIILESALETARVTADMLYTVFKLGLEWQTPAEAAGLKGTIVAPPLPANEDQEAQVVLADTDYATLTESSMETDHRQWRGGFSFRNLPPGEYTVVVYRVGSQPATAKVQLQPGKTARLEFHLQSTEPAGNLVYNPDGRLHLLPNATPDRWTKQGNTYSSAPITLRRRMSYLCGAVRKDPQAKIFFHMPGVQQGGQPTPQPIRKELPADGSQLELASDPDHMTMIVQVESTKPLTEAIEKVWVCAVPSKTPAQTPGVEKRKMPEKQPLLQK